MHKHLFFICPTDCLEALINNAFEGQNYFVTSLGNSILLDAVKMEEINKLLLSHGIEEITFVLANDNRIILDAMQNQEFSRVKGLRDLYKEIYKQKKRLNMMWLTGSCSVPILNAYLNARVKTLALQLSACYTHHLEVNSSIYRRDKGIFSEVHSDLFQLERSSLN